MIMRDMIHNRNKNMFHIKKKKETECNKLGSCGVSVENMRANTKCRANDFDTQTLTNQIELDANKLL